MAIEQVSMISTTYVKERSPMFENTSEKIVQESILECQIMYIEELLGTTLYNEILGQIEASDPRLPASTPIPADNKLLLDKYISSTLKFYTLVETAYYVTDSFTPSGVKRLTPTRVEKRTEVSTQEITRDEFKSYQSTWSKRAEFWAQRTTDFLREEYSSSNKYPAYGDQSDRLDAKKAIKNNYTSAIYFDKGRNCPGNGYDYEH